MAELETISAEAKERVEQLGSADCVICVPSCGSAEALGSAITELGAVLPALGDGRKAVLLHPDTASLPDTGIDSIRLLPSPMPSFDWSDLEVRSDALRSLFLVGKQVNAKVCAVWNATLERTARSEVELLVRPVLHHGYDLTLPRYARRKFEGLINSSIVNPLTQALYGSRIHFPMATDLALSPRLMDLCLLPQAGSSRPQGLAWIASKASCAGLQICEANFGPPPQPKDSAELSSVLAQVLGSLFLDMDRNAVCWQRSRISQPVRTFGEAQTLTEETPAVDVSKMVDTFQRASRDLLDIWGVVLPPATLIDLRRLAKVPPDQFRFPDDLWVRMVYDFALGHRQRVMNRDHLLRAMTPAYLAWVASYALEVQDAGPRQVEDRLEALCRAFETNKPYLLSRWRWPDRFNP